MVFCGLGACGENQYCNNQVPCIPHENKSPRPLDEEVLLPRAKDQRSKKMKRSMQMQEKKRVPLTKIKPAEKSQEQGIEERDRPPVKVPIQKTSPLRKMRRKKQNLRMRMRVRRPAKHWKVKRKQI